MASVIEAEHRVGRDLLEDLVTGRDERTVLQRARAFGFDLTRPYRIALVHPTTPRDTGADEGGPVDDALPVVRRLARELGVELIASARPEGVLLLAAGDPPWETLQRSLEGHRGDIRWRVAVGGPCRQPADALRSYRESLLIRPLQQSPGAAGVLRWETLGVYRILTSMEDFDALDRLVTEQLGALLDHDAERGSRLVETLHHYLESGGSPTLTAKALFVHASTVKYRLTRIREVGGYDLSAPSTRFALQLATQAWLVLRALREPLPGPSPQAPDHLVDP
jgi:sugar diacid utilization regulator